MQRIMKFSIPIFLVCVALLIWAVAFSDDAQRVEAQNSGTCTVQNLNSEYVLATFGSIAPGNPYGFTPGPENSAGRLTHDGNGNYTVIRKTSLNGTIGDQFIDGTYTVSEGCVVTYTHLNIPVVQIVYTNNRKEGMGLHLLPGMNITFLVKQ